MKTFAEFQEAFIAKNRNRRGGKLDPKVLRDNPDLDPLNPRDYMKLKRIQNSIEPDLALKTEEAVAPTNNVGGGQIAGTVEAGDDPPVKKKRKKGEPTIIARGCMPGARSRFKGGVQLLASLKKNKYT